MQQQLSCLCLIALGHLPSPAWDDQMGRVPECFLLNALQKGCAAAVLVGLDVSPQPGLRGPTNFAGICGPALLQEMDAVLTAADTKFR